MSKTVDLGPVSAYALAVKYGYTGTEEEWVAEMESKRKEAVEAAGAAADSEASAANYAAASASSASTASNKADAAVNSATRAESYAVGGTGIRQNEDVDNAKYYYQQIKQISGGMSGALIPLGTVAFADLQDQTKQVGYMYNISDDFTTDDTFKDGSGYTYPAGTNVYHTADGYWDCLAGTITPEGIGALAIDGDSAENVITFESEDAAEANVWTDVDVLVSGEKHKSILKKVSTMFKNVRYLYKMLGATDISTLGDGTCTGAIAAQNEALATVRSDVSALSDIKIVKVTNGSGIAGSIACYVKSSVCYVYMEITPATVTNYGIIASGFPTPWGFTPLVSLGTGGGNYTARMRADGVFEFYFPAFTTVARVDSSFCYLTSG